MSDNEPWLPPGHAERLTVSARVRIRLSGECPHSPPELDGAAGYIAHILEPGERAQYSGGMELDVGGHRYAVVPKLPLNTAGSFCWLAAAELEPVETVAEHNARVWNERVVGDGQRGSVTDMGMIVVEREQGEAE